MKAVGQGTSVSQPRWDGDRIMFEVEDRGRRMPCAIYRGALEELTGQRHFKPAELLRCFAEARGLIEMIALAKLKTRPAGVSGLLNIWSNDIGARSGERDGQGPKAQRPRAQEAQGSQEAGRGGSACIQPAAAAQEAGAEIRREVTTPPTITQELSE